jgi:hypothetical protein
MRHTTPVPPHSLRKLSPVSGQRERATLPFWYWQGVWYALMLVVNADVTANPPITPLRLRQGFHATMSRTSNLTPQARAALIYFQHTNDSELDFDPFPH